MRFLSFTLPLLLAVIAFFSPAAIGQIAHSQPGGRANSPGASPQQSPTSVDRPPLNSLRWLESLSAEAKQGYDLIVNKRYLPADFNEKVFSQVWQVWPEPIRSKAERASESERRQMAFARYGLTPRPDDPNKPLQYVVDASGKWAMNCFACHAGSRYGQSTATPGLPNNRIALETLYDDMRAIKRELKVPFSGMDIGSALIPMGTTSGTSNAVIFGVSLMAFRDKDLDLKSLVIPPFVTHHDMDAPPWWNYGRKKMLYIDGFTLRQHRALMPFIMVKQNDGPRFRNFENDFKKIEKFILATETPDYSGRLDADRLRQGKEVFENRCASCHGTYGKRSEYPEKTIAIDTIGTDPVRFNGLSKSYRQRYKESWLSEYGKARTLTAPKGYVAPPLNGIWASAPYFHNGSVPTLRGVLHPEVRPEIWTRRDVGFDSGEVGLTIQELKPGQLNDFVGDDPARQRLIFDTRKFGKGNDGHDFGADLSESETDCLLEYLKSL